MMSKTYFWKSVSDLESVLGLRMHPDMTWFDLQKYLVCGVAAGLLVYLADCKGWIVKSRSVRHPRLQLWEYGRDLYEANQALDSARGSFLDS